MDADKLKGMLDGLAPMAEKVNQAIGELAKDLPSKMEEMNPEQREQILKDVNDIKERTMAAAKKRNELWEH